MNIEELEMEEKELLDQLAANRKKQRAGRLKLENAKPNHKETYPYNYSLLLRDVEYAITELGLIQDDVPDAPGMYIKRVINDLKKAINETKQNLSL